MKPLPALLLCAALLGSASAAGQVAVVTLVDAGSRVLRAATWYKLVPGARIEDADIVDVAEHAQVQLELVPGSMVNVVGPCTLHVVRASAPDSPSTLALSRGWIKAAAKPPGVRLHTPQADVVSTAGIVVMRASGTPELFVESATARLIELAANGAEVAVHDVKRGEHWSRGGDGRYAMAPRAPKAFIEAMPRHYADALPSLAARYKSAPQLAVDRDITYAEAEPWLAGRERAVFEKRFATRLRDPAFRKAVEPHVARYPSWDRMLHPEKFAPKPAPAPAGASKRAEESK